MQLTGPVPNELYHRYVEFKSFVGGMFQGSGLRGRVLNKALHHQHQNIYAFTNRTEHGYLESDKEKTLRFLRMAHFDQGGRTFTYVLTLDGLLRFCETGPEFGIDLLS
jgi:Arf-GAP/SH3 domain/ANK repeat/PH domain-containing protein